MPLGTNKIVSSIVDRNTRPLEVYAVQLQAGRQVRFRVVPDTDLSEVDLYNPGSTAVASGNNTLAFGSYISEKTTWTKDFAPAVSGTYYFVVSAEGSSQRYTLSIA